MAKLEVSKRLVLIDGEQLTKLMIRHNVGCKIEDTLHIEKTDEVFFRLTLVAQSADPYSPGRHIS